VLPEDQASYPPLTATLKDGRSVRLRLISVADTSALSDFYASLPRETWRFYCPPRLTHEDAVRRAAEAEAPTVVCLVAEEPWSGAIVGYAWYRWRDEGEQPGGSRQPSDSRQPSGSELPSDSGLLSGTAQSSIFGICLREAYRGAGLGQALIARLLEIARAVGPPVMALTVQLANPRAVALYQKMGFRIVREQMREAIGDFVAEPEYAMEQVVRRAQPH